MTTSPHEPSARIRAEVATLRARYPDALVCTACALLLATRRESYAKSNLTEDQRLGYVCAECRLQAAEAARTLAARQANLQAAREVSARTRRQRARKRAPVSLPAGDDRRAPRPRENKDESRGIILTVQSRHRGLRSRRGGRPVRLTDEERQRANREYARAFRARQRRPDPDPVPAA
jgi:hypothetical protein